MNDRVELRAQYRRMTPDDLGAVLSIEQAVYSHPWTLGNFADSLAAGYHCWIMECGGVMTGYSVLMVAGEEAHLLNLSIAADWQRRGLGSAFAGFIFRLARDYGAQRLLLEVRASNLGAQTLYVRNGFRQIGSRKGYYPADTGREDALVLERVL